jgi:hypothetical protein
MALKLLLALGRMGLRCPVQALGPDADRRLVHTRGRKIVAVRKKTRPGQSCLVDEDWTCARCSGVVLCMPWCESVNARVNYAHDAVRHPSHLSIGDRLILHALGVRWSARTAPPKVSTLYRKARAGIWIDSQHGECSYTVGLSR